MATYTVDTPLNANRKDRRLGSTPEQHTAGERTASPRPVERGRLETHLSLMEADLQQLKGKRSLFAVGMRERLEARIAETRAQLEAMPVEAPPASVPCTALVAASCVAIVVYARPAVARPAVNVIPSGEVIYLPSPGSAKPTAITPLQVGDEVSPVYSEGYYYRVLAIEGHVLTINRKSGRPPFAPTSTISITSVSSFARRNGQVIRVR